MGTKEELIRLILSSPSFTEKETFAKRGYLPTLRQNREELASGIVGTKKDAFGKSELIAKTMSIQNRTRGRLGELLGRAAMTWHTEAVDTDMVTDKAVFDTPFGRRRVDLYWEAKKLAVESKMGFVTCSAGIRQQIEKDAYLLKQGTLDTVVWMLIKGATVCVRRLLEANSIVYKEGWPSLRMHGDSE